MTCEAIAILLAGTMLLLAGCEPHQDLPYEFRFNNEIYLEFPIGYDLELGKENYDEIDELLRSRRCGYVSGMMGTGRTGDPDKLEVEHMTLAVDLELVQPEDLVNELTQRKLVPVGVEIRTD